MLAMWLTLFLVLTTLKWTRNAENCCRGWIFEGSHVSLYIPFPLYLARSQFVRHLLSLSWDQGRVTKLYISMPRCSTHHCEVKRDILRLLTEVANPYTSSRLLSSVTLPRVLA